MSKKTIAIDAEIYEELSKHCKENGLLLKNYVERLIKNNLKTIEENNNE